MFCQRSARLCKKFFLRFWPGEQRDRPAAVILMSANLLFLQLIPYIMPAASQDLVIHLYFLSKIELSRCQNILLEM